MPGEHTTELLRVAAAPTMLPAADTPTDSLLAADNTDMGQPKVVLEKGAAVCHSALS